MSDFVLIPDLGHGAWSWAKVWGLLDGDESGSVGRVLAVDLPGTGSRGNAPADKITFESCVDAVLQDVQAEGLRSPIIAAHGFGAMVALTVAAKLQPAPERLVFIAGALPETGHSYVEGLTLRAQLALSGFGLFKARTAVTLNKGAARFLLTNDASFPVAAGSVIGYLEPLPRSLLFLRWTAPLFPAPLPMTYVVLRRDQYLDPREQERMATRMPSKLVDVQELPLGHEAPVLAPKAVYPLIVRNALPSRRQGLRLVSQYKLAPS